MRLDPTGRVPGRIGLFVERYAAVARPRGVVLALAGGPGQSGVKLLRVFRDTLAPILGDRALVVFDERGIGRSAPLDCRLDPSGNQTARAALATCVKGLGRRVRFYSSDDTVTDIESIRRALHLGRLDLYGVSYGTFPATQYARRYPGHVSHLVLDSTLPLDGDQDVKLNSLTSIRRQLASICTVVCPALDPVGDLGELLAAARRSPLAVTLVPHEAPQRLTATALGIIAYKALFASDLAGFVRASIPSALHLGANGNGSALLRLDGLANDVVLAAAGLDDAGGAALALPGRAAAAAAAARRRGTVRVNVEPVATRCEDERFVWSARDSLGERRRAVARLQASLSAAQTAPFDARTAVAGSEIALCADWPTAGSHPSRELGPAPSVPTLILSGQNDVRTPLEQARTVAAEIPGARLLEVPNVGHAVLLHDTTGCAARALGAFFASTGQILPCVAGLTPAVDPLPPATLASLAPAGSLTGVPGETLAASVLTLRHDVAIAEPYPAHELLNEIPGTLGGEVFAIAPGAPVYLDRVTYVPGVALTGTVSSTGAPYAAGRLTVMLDGRHYGVLRLVANGTIRGTLGGATFVLTAAAREAIDAAGGLDFAGRPAGGRS